MRQTALSHMYDFLFIFFSKKLRTTQNQDTIMQKKLY